MPSIGSMWSVSSDPPHPRLFRADVDKTRPCWLSSGDIVTVLSPRMKGENEAYFIVIHSGSSESGVFICYESWFNVHQGRHFEEVML